MGVAVALMIGEQAAICLKQRRHLLYELLHKYSKRQKSAVGSWGVHQLSRRNNKRKWMLHFKYTLLRDQSSRNRVNTIYTTFNNIHLDKNRGVQTPDLQLLNFELIAVSKETI